MEHSEHNTQLSKHPELRHSAQPASQSNSDQVQELKQQVLHLQHALTQARNTEKRYQDLFNYSQALICTHSMDGRMITVNPATCKVLLYTEQELLGRNISEFMSEKRRKEFINVYLPSIQREKKAQGVLSMINKAGAKVHLLVEYYKVEEEGAEPYMFGFSLDITERVNAEHKLVDANRVIQKASEAKETFLANVSHEIRTPMNGILGVAALLAKTNLNEQQQNFLKLIQDSANNLLVIVNDVLDLEKIIAGKLQLEKLAFKIVDKVTLLVQSFIYRAEDKGLAIIYQTAIPVDMVVIGDPFRLSQVLNNLLNNALKFTNKGNITITTSTKVITDDSTIIEFNVKDTGIGIKENILKQIFEPFVQADVSTSRKYGGTGLGLTICKNLIELQGGTLSVQSVENSGSIFSFRIPYFISKEPINQSDQLEQINYASLGKKKILVAEDVELNQFIVKHMLESWGCEVSIAGDGLQAVSLLKNHYYDLVLMDIQMPHMDGMAATAHIRTMKDPIKANIPIVALTANALKSDSDTYLAAGMNDYLSKPFGEAKLFQVISRNLITNEKSTIMQKDQPLETKPITNESLFDLSTIRTISGGDEDFVKKMIELFIETVPLNLKELNTSLDRKNWDLLSKSAHKLKSTIDSMGINSIREDVRIVEANAKKKEALEELPTHIRKINTVVNECVRLLELELHVEL